MTPTPLFQSLAPTGVAGGDYAGAATPRRIAALDREFAALEHGCGLFDLGWRSKLVLTGADRLRWLNGMVTNNIRDLQPGHGNYSFLLNAQGHILGDLFAYHRGDYLLLDTDAAQAPRLKELFDKFIIMDDVEVTDIGSKLTALGLRGPKTLEVLAAAGLRSRDLQPGEVEDLTWSDLGISLVRTAPPDPPGYEIWLAPASVRAAWDKLLQAGATPVGFEAVELYRVAHGIPRYGQDIRERDLPQETEQLHALNFSKGCYLGQEIVERIRSRGAVHRTFTGFRIQGDTPAPGAKLQAAGKDVGELTSVASLPGNGGRTVALGYIRRDAAAPGAELDAAGAKAVVTALPEKEKGSGG